MTISFSRRNFLQAAAGIMSIARARLRSFARVGSSIAHTPVPESKKLGRLFPANLPAAKWQEFRAAGYSNPVTGIVYRNAPSFIGLEDRPRPVSGVPLGGIDTGGLYLEGFGAFGYSSIFNNYVPPGGPLNRPFLGIGIGGQTHVLTTGQTKNYAGRNQSSLGPVLSFAGGTGTAKTIDYWGHYPIVDMQYKTGAPVEVSLRAWAPFIPGDAQTSNTPGAVFEIHLTNNGSSRQAGTLAFSFPGFGKHRTRDEVIGWFNLPKEIELPAPHIERRPAPADLSGVWMEEKAWGMSYVLAALDEKSIRVGGELGTDGIKWAAIEKGLPEIAQDDGGSSLAVDFSLEPGQEKVVRLILAWYAPEWEGNGNPGTGGRPILTKSGGRLVSYSTGKRFTHMYASRFANAGEVADFLARNHQSLLDRIIAWQSVIYGDKELPGWLADSLINAFYYYAPCSLWAQAKPPIGDWCKPEDGLFAMIESPRACPNVSTLPNITMMGPFVEYFFPDLAVSMMRSFKAAQKENGDVPCLAGHWADPATPASYGYQEVMNGANYMLQLDCHWKVTGDEEFLKEFYPSAKQALEYSFNRRPDLGLSQIVAMPPYESGTANELEWYEDRRVWGYAVHPGGYRMAAAEMLREWAVKMGDTEHVKRLDARLEAGKEAMQKYLWRGDHYLVYNDPQTGKQLDAFFSAQLNGQFWARLHGVQPVFPQQNIATVLAVLRDKVCKISKLGMPPTFANPDGTVWTGEVNGYMTGKYNWNDTQAILCALTFAYEGQRDFGLELLHKYCEINACQWGYMWDGPCSHSAFEDNGEVTYGWDYWFDACIWAAPAALANQDLSGPCKADGLVDRIIKAGKTGRMA
jgi:uncharacterized protein (DUF608 family)